MWKPLTLPFFADSNSLPASLPTEQEIESSNNVISRQIYRSVVVVGKHFLVKYGTIVNQLLAEGQNLFFVQQNLAISAPRLYAMFYGSKEQVYIVMELLPGQNLQTQWPRLSDHDKILIAKKLRVLFDEMRRLPSRGFYGDVCRGKIPYHLFHTHAGDTSSSGPFINEHDFNMALPKRARTMWTENGLFGRKADFYEKHLSKALCNHPPTFTHSDLQKKNVIVQEIAQAKAGGKKDFRVWLVDWEAAGWYPSYWEYASAFNCFSWDDDWCEKVELMVDPWVSEASLVKMVHIDMWF